MGLFRQQGIDFPNRQSGGSQRVAVVAAVKRVQKGAVVSHKSYLGGGGAGVYAQIAVSTVGGQIPGCHPMPAVAPLKSVIFVLGGKQRLHPFHFKFHFNFRGKFL